jgi:hypothetical protein
VVKDNVAYTTTVTSRTTTTFDEDGLKKAMGAKAYAKVTTPKLDTKKLSAAVDAGEIDPGVIAQHAHMHAGARSIRLTRKVADGKAEEA